MRHTQSPARSVHRCRGRTAAPCQSCGWWVSAARPPNRTCPFLSIRLSTGSGRRAPWGRDTGSSVAVASHRDLPGAEELDPAGADPPAGEVTPDQGAHTDAGVSFLQPADDPPEGEMVEIAEGALRHAVAEVGAPTSDHRVEPAQQVGERAMRCPPGQPSYLVEDRSQRLLRRVGIDVAFPGLVTFLAATLDAPAEEVEPVVYVDDSGLGLRQAQTYRLQHRRHITPQRFGIGPVAVDHNHEVVGAADELHDRAPGAAMLDAPPFRPERLPFGVEVLIENGQGDVGQQR